jgi:hypothetical protein
MSEGSSVSPLRLDVKRLSELLGSSESEAAMFLKFCEHHINNTLILPPNESSASAWQ